MRLPVYLDNHSTTQCDPRVVEAMLPCFTENYGNSASSAHSYGWQAKEAVEQARNQVAALAGSEPAEVIFTSGATESINLVLKGISYKRSWSSLRIITCETEHTAVLDTCAILESYGAHITRLPVDAEGKLHLGLLESAVSQGADLVSLMHANNEIGTLHPVKEIASLCSRYSIPLHIDAAQSFGKIPIEFRNWGVSFLSLSGHKLYAPKGIGALLVRRENPPLRLMPLLHGGGHERGFRSGTLNVPGIVGLGKAAKISFHQMEEDTKRTQVLRLTLTNRLLEGIYGLIINGSMENRLPGNLNVSIPGIEAQHLLPALRGSISVSSGSACTSAKPGPSYVLAALGRSPELAHASLRFGIGRFNTLEEINFAADTVIAVTKELRQAARQNRP